MNVRVTGATGYIGGRLVPRLLGEGHSVRVLVRDRHRIEGRAWARDVEVVEGDLGDPASLPPAFAGVDGAYYLVHSMYDTRDFAKHDRRLANNFAEAAQGVARVVYLGGLLPHADDVSEHLRSRAEVGEILRERTGATELRAGPIIGSGSASFEMVRYLTERIPAMIAPRWIMNDVQPVAVRDVLTYLLLALRLRGVMDRAVGGPGLRRGRRDPDQLLPGEALDFWRVEASDPPRMLRLRAEMRVPGKAWLEWLTFPEDGGTRLVQTAIFAPKGLSGFLYWYASFPAHKVIFTGMVNEVARRARAGDNAPAPLPEPADTM